MARDDPHFRLRIPEGMRERVTQAAKANKRSINAEIVARLEESLSINSSFDKEAFANELAVSFIEASAKALRSALPTFPDDSDPDYGETSNERSPIEPVRNHRAFTSPVARYEQDFFRTHESLEKSKLGTPRTGTDFDRVADEAYKSGSHAKHGSSEDEDLESESLSRLTEAASRKLVDNLADCGAERTWSSRMAKDDRIESLREQLLSLEERLQRLK